MFAESVGSPQFYEDPGGNGQHLLEPPSEWIHSVLLK
jgi:hypothetical protein